jgi:hypothetical protein
MSGLNRDDIIRMAKEASFHCGPNEVYVGGYNSTEDLERFAALVAAAEREACVKDVSNALYGQDGCGKAIEAIRARGRSEALTNLNKAAENMGQEL